MRLIIVNGSPNEVNAVLEKYGLLSDGKEVVKSIAGKVETTSWTMEEVRMMWPGLTPGCRNILEYLSKRPEGVDWLKMQEDLGLEARAIGGRISSIGHQRRNLGLDEKPDVLIPIDTMDGKDGYRLDPTWIAVIKDLAT